MPQNPYSPFNNDLGAIVTLTAASAGGNSPDLANGQGRGVKIIVDITAISGTSATLTVTIQGKDPASGSYYTLLAGAGLTATGVTVMTVYPAAVVTANVSANDHVPQFWRLLWTITGTTPSVTATLGGCILV